MVARNSAAWRRLFAALLIFVTPELLANGNGSGAGADDAWRAPEAVPAGNHPWLSPLKDFDGAALEKRVRRCRAVVRKEPKNNKARNDLADASVAFALASEAARALEETEKADQYLKFVADRLPDTMWRVGHRAGKGNIEALAARAVFQEHGVVIERDKALACDAWIDAAAGGNAFGQYRSALCVAETDQAASVAFMRSAADQGHPAAQHSLAEICLLESPPDYECAVRWSTASAMQGRVSAQGLAGWLHFSGQKSGLTDDQALTFLEAAADSGDLAAMTNLGQVLETGAGGDARKAEAVEWYRKAADEGFAPAQYNLGRLYVLGEVVARNIAQARLWLTLAEDGGVAQAGEMLDWLTRQEGGEEAAGTSGSAPE